MFNHLKKFDNCEAGQISAIKHKYVWTSNSKKENILMIDEAAEKRWQIRYYIYCGFVKWEKLYLKHI